jgi:hypothetical protein
MFFFGKEIITLAMTTIRENMILHNNGFVNLVQSRGFGECFNDVHYIPVKVCSIMKVIHLLRN